MILQILKPKEMLRSKQTECLKSNAFKLHLPLQEIEVGFGFRNLKKEHKILVKGSL